MQDGLAPIAEFLLCEVEAHPRDLVSLATARFSVSRQAVHRHLGALIAEGRICAGGRTQARRYGLAVLAEVEASLDSPSDAGEDLLWRSRLLPELAEVPSSVVEILRFGFTEIARNAREHSGTDGIAVRLRRTALHLDLRITDRGLGIFRRLEEHPGVDGPRRAALEIVKGEITTAVDRPTGRSLPLVASAFDHFLLASGGHLLRRGIGAGDGSWRFEPIAARVRGTSVGMRIGTRSKRSLASVVAGSPAARAEVPVRLALDEPEQPTSREQARRIASRIERFGELVLDFEGIEGVGPAFADELFRVVPREHPRVRLSFRNARPAVARVLQRAAEEGTPRCGPPGSGI